MGTSAAVKEAVKAGLGVSILSLRALETELEIGLLRALKIRGLPMTRYFYLIRDKRRIASPLCKAMQEFLLTTSQE
jgi:DNA-binding transcriptional LysR family regulator